MMTVVAEAVDHRAMLRDALIQNYVEINISTALPQRTVSGDLESLGVQLADLEVLRMAISGTPPFKLLSPAFYKEFDRRRAKAKNIRSEHAIEFGGQFLISVSKAMETDNAIEKVCEEWRDFLEAIDLNVYVEERKIALEAWAERLGQRAGDEAAHTYRSYVFPKIASPEILKEHSSIGHAIQPLRLALPDLKNFDTSVAARMNNASLDMAEEIDKQLSQKFARDMVELLDVLRPVGVTDLGTVMMGKVERQLTRLEDHRHVLHDSNIEKGIKFLRAVRMQNADPAEIAKLRSEFAAQAELQSVEEPVFEEHDEMFEI